MQSSLFIVIPLCLVFQKLMKKMFIYYNSVMVVFHYPILNVAMPAIVVTVFRLINPAIFADLQKSLTELAVEVPPPPPELSSLAEAGYSSFDLFTNLGVLRGLIYFYAAKMVAYCVLKQCEQFSTRAKNWNDTLRSSLFFSGLLLIFEEGYMEILVSSIIAIQNLNIIPQNTQRVLVETN